MTLIEKIQKEINNCENLIAECDKDIHDLTIKKTCYTDTLEMLHEMLDKAKTDADETPIEKPIQKAIRKKKTAQQNEIGKADEPVKHIGVSLTQLAKDLNTPSVELANACNQLGINDEIAHNDYLISDENAHKIKEYLDKERSYSNERPGNEGNNT